MSMEHKAFVFDYDTFLQELADILVNALVINQSNDLITFIENNFSYLKYPDEGEPLDSFWKETIETNDISQYADQIKVRLLEYCQNLAKSLSLLLQ